MQIITLAAQKGGVGKTTLAVNLAVAAQAAGIKTALFDLDPQESATAWSERRTAELPHVEPISARRLNQAIDAAEANVSLLPSSTRRQLPVQRPRQRRSVLTSFVIPCRPSLIRLGRDQAELRSLSPHRRMGVGRAERGSSTDNYAAG